MRIIHIGLFVCCIPDPAAHAQHPQHSPQHSRTQPPQPLFVSSLSSASPSLIYPAACAFWSWLALGCAWECDSGGFNQEVTIFCYRYRSPLFHSFEFVSRDGSITVSGSASAQPIHPPNWPNIIPGYLQHLGQPDTLVNQLKSHTNHSYKARKRKVSLCRSKYTQLPHHRSPPSPPRAPPLLPIWHTTTTTTTTTTLPHPPPTPAMPGTATAPTQAPPATAPLFPRAQVPPHHREPHPLLDHTPRSRSQGMHTDRRQFRKDTPPHGAMVGIMQGIRRTGGGMWLRLWHMPILCLRCNHLYLAREVRVEGTQSLRA